MILGWINGLSGIAKLGLILAILTAVIGAMHWYNAGLIDQGKAEVRLEWADATKKTAAAQEAERTRVEAEKVALAKKYYAERAARLATQKKLDQEREDAIRNSRVAANVCFDERMRDAWNRSSGHPADNADSEAGRSVAPAVR